jgi:hypothetical protein
MLWSVVDKFLSFFCGDRYLVWLRPRACISIKRLGKGKIKLRPNPIWWKRPRQWINGAVGRKSMATLLILTTSVQKFDGVGKMWLNLIFTFIFLMYSTDFLWTVSVFQKSDSDRSHRILIISRKMSRIFKPAHDTWEKGRTLVRPARGDGVRLRTTDYYLACTTGHSWAVVGERGVTVSLRWAGRCSSSTALQAGGWLVHSLGYRTSWGLGAGGPSRLVGQFRIRPERNGSELELHLDLDLGFPI